MKKTIYTIFDSVTGVYWHPFFALNNDEANRSIGDIVNKPGENDLFMHPGDFTLYAIGTFCDQRDEEILSVSLPMQFICRCDSLVSPVKDEVFK